jgi:hypothetical protein
MQEHFQKDQDVIALILGGSVAKGEARPDSDLDAMVIITDQAYEKRKAEGQTTENIPCMCTYPEGYFDIKYFNKKYLKAAAERGSDPTRNSFVKSKVIFSSDSEIESIIKRIQTYPREKKHERILMFHSILRYSSGYFYWSGVRNNDPYMLDKCCFEIVYAGLRLLFVHNEIFFPSHLRLLQYSESLPHKPSGIIEMAKAVNEKKDADTIQAFADAVLNFTDWGVDPESYHAVHVDGIEQAWQNSDDNVYEL